MKKKINFHSIDTNKKKIDGLRNKNFKKLNGIPLFEIAIKSALRSKLIHSTFVTSTQRNLSKSSKLGCNIIKGLQVYVKKILKQIPLFIMLLSLLKKSLI